MDGSEHNRPTSPPPGNWQERQKTPTATENQGSAQAKLTAPTLQSGTLLKRQTEQDDTLKVAVSPPWLLTLPRGMLARLQFELSDEFPLPTALIILILYAGPDDATSLESAIHS